MKVLFLARGMWCSVVNVDSAIYGMQRAGVAA